MKNDEGKKSCKTCVHCDLPAKSEICLDCWNYQRWEELEAERNQHV